MVLRISSLDFLGLAVFRVVLWRDVVDSALLGRGGCGGLLDVFVVFVFFFVVLLFLFSSSIRVGVSQQERSQPGLCLQAEMRSKPYTSDRSPKGPPYRLPVLFVLFILALAPVLALISLELLVVLVAVVPAVVPGVLGDNGDRLLCHTVSRGRVVLRGGHSGG
ncbi:hypothetical protein FB451DRAFT_1216777, partial [Mycena latifolia]